MNRINHIPNIHLGYLTPLTTNIHHEIAIKNSCDYRIYIQPNISQLNTHPATEIGPALARSISWRERHTHTALLIKLFPPSFSFILFSTRNAKLPLVHIYVPANGEPLSVEPPSRLCSCTVWRSRCCGGRGSQARHTTCPSIRRLHHRLYSGLRCSSAR